MKSKLHIWILCFILALLLAGCSADKNSAGKDLQRLSLIEVYSSDGKLINSIEDVDTLYQFENLDYIDIPEDTASEQTELENMIVELSPLYTIISYKTPAAIYGSETLEKLTEITVYDNSNIIKEQVDPENIKGVSIPEEYLSFYFTVSEEDKTFLLSLATFDN